MTTLEVLETIDTKNSKFIQYYKDETEEALNKLMIYIKRMSEGKDGKFTRHYMQPKSRHW